LGQGEGLNPKINEEPVQLRMQGVVGAGG
jgi:hypothetical protein